MKALLITLFISGMAIFMYGIYLIQMDRYNEKKRKYEEDEEEING